MKINRSKYTHRYMARLIMEAVTPLSISKGEGNVQTDSLVLKDCNDLPYIPGTSIAGVVRHAMKDNGLDSIEELFGNCNSSTSIGSRILFSEGKLIGKDSEVIDGITDINFKDSFWDLFAELPIRQHVRISSKGVSSNRGKFDEQIIPKGARFCFEFEIQDEEAKEDTFKNVLQTIASHHFRLGGGTRSGFGEMKIISLKSAVLDLRNEDSLDLYLSKSSSLNESATWKGWNADSIEKNNNDFICYELKLQANDFVCFGSGHGDESADATSLSESFIGWNGHNAEIQKTCHIIPGTSFKGAIAHRTAYYFNKMNRLFVGNTDAHAGKDNSAVKELFGSEGEFVGNNLKNQKRGIVLFSDLIEYSTSQHKTFNHVKIDQFTGGAIQGALYNENTYYAKDKEYRLHLSVPSQTQMNYLKALEMALKDVCQGILPLGGFVNRGHGTFSGVLTKNGKEI